jgi:translation initiation factor IF-3
VLDYSKYKYEQEQKRKAARKHQQQVTIREMKLRPKIAQNDYDTKKGHILRFLKQGDKVKITIMFRGREVAHPERGSALCMKLAEEVSEFGTIEQHPSQEGRNMTMMLAPVRAAGTRGKSDEKKPSEEGKAETDGSGAATKQEADKEPAAGEPEAAAEPATTAEPEPAPEQQAAASE